MYMLASKCRDAAVRCYGFGLKSGSSEGQWVDSPSSHLSVEPFSRPGLEKDAEPK